MSKAQEKKMDGLTHQPKQAYCSYICVWRARWSRTAESLLSCSKPATCEGRSQVQIQTVWRNKHPESHQILLCSEDVYQKVALSSLLFISLTAAVISGGDLHCRVFMFYNVDC